MRYGEAYEALEESLRRHPVYGPQVPPASAHPAPRFYYSTNK